MSDSGDEDLAPKKREKPKIQLTPKPRSATPTAAAATTSCPSLAKDDGKPITSKSSADDSNRTDEIERPRTSRGKQKITDDLSNSPQLLATAETRLLPPGPSRKEVLKLDNSLTAGSLNGTQVDFGDAGDDLLSGMGLDDSDVIGGSLKPGVHISKSERRGSVLDELLGTKGSSTKTTENKMKERSKESDDHDGDAFQFGDYLPSAAADSAVSTTPTRTNKSNLKLPSGRRGSSEHSDILTSRPGSAPALAKKSVRFADTVETSERPSSSPANSEVARTTPSSGSGSGKSSSSSAVAAASSDVDAATSQGSDGSRKPPLPKRSASAIDSGRNKEVHSVDGSGGSVESVPKEEEPRDEMDNELMGNEIDAQSQIVASDR